MPREVDVKQSFPDKAVKLVPTEIVGTYLAIAGILGFAPVETGAALEHSTDANGVNEMLIQVVFFVLLAFTPVYLRKVSGVRNVYQLAATTLSFAIWVYTLGGPFVVWGFFYPAAGAVTLTLWSLIVPTLVPVRPEPSPA